MGTEVRLPQVGMAMTDGEVTTWHKAVGERVEQGEIIVEVEAAKAVVEVEAPVAGILDKILAESGVVIAVLDVLGVIREDSAAHPADEPAPDPEPRASESTPAAAAPALPQPDAVALLVPVRDGNTERVGVADEPDTTPRRAAPRRKISPAARRLAAELAIDLAAVRGSGPDGRVLREDVRTHSGRQPVDASAPGALPAGEQPLGFLSTEVDVTELVRRRPGLRRAHGATYTDILVRAVALAVADEGCIRPAGGVVVRIVESHGPSQVLRSVDRLSLAEIAARRNASDEDEASVVVTNLGDNGVDTCTPVLAPGTVLGVGAGRITERLFRRSAGAEWRKTITLTMAVRAPAIDLRAAGTLMQRITQRLGAPDDLL